MFHKANLLCISLFMLCSISIGASFASIFVVPEQEDIIGEVQFAYSEINESIEDVGRNYGVGYYEMIRANPRVDKHRLLVAHSPLIIPSQFIIPNVSRKGIIINLAEYRLYYFPADENIVVTFPIGIGRAGWSTPLGHTTITSKTSNPTWRPTQRLLDAAEELGAPIPDSFPPGPHNPLGKYALRLGWPTFLIHGTNNVDGIGARVSAGCIRMLPDDIEYLFNNVPVGTSVRVINEPIKIGRKKGRIYLQVHSPLVEQKNIQLSELLVKKLEQFTLKGYSINQSVLHELDHPSGLIQRLE